MIRQFPRVLSCRNLCTAPSALPKHTATQSTSKRVITCKNKELNVISGPKGIAERSAKFGSIALASKGWGHRKSKGDFFTLHPITTSSNTELPSTFSSLGLDPEIIDEVLHNRLHIESPTPFQSLAVPQLLHMDHALLAAETGCGKTLAYLLPILQSVRALGENSRRFNTPLALVLLPGRELAEQVGQVAQSLGLQTKVVVGGHTKRLMLNPSFEDVDLLVGTVGALSKLVTNGIYRMERVRHVVLDEADTLLDDSFNEKLGYFLRRFPFHKNAWATEKVVGTQLMLVSATLPTDPEALLLPLLGPGGAQTVRRISSPGLHQLQRKVTQRFMRMNKSDRPSQLLGIVKGEVQRGRPVLVFSNRTPTADFVSLLLNGAGVECLNLTGDMQVAIREGRFAQFQNGQCPVLSTTDVASRGLDTGAVAHVVNFDFPLHVADYIHRCGRVGRVGSAVKDAVVTNLVSSGREISLVQRIEHAARTDHQLHDVNANITGIIRDRILRNMGEPSAAA